MRRAGALLVVGAGSLALALLLPRPTAAAWPTDPLVNVPLCTATGDQAAPISVPDGAGGAIVAWHDYRGDLYAQRVSAGGALQWAVGGVALCTAAGDQTNPGITPDGAGGAIVCWQDGRTSGVATDLYAQRISAGGAVQWTADGVALCTATGMQSYPAIAPDGAGGAIVTWSDFRGGATSDLYAQRISADGLVQWAADGVALCAATGNQTHPGIVPDGAGGAIVAWQDSRSGNSDLYAQRISAGGAARWATDGVALCTATGDQWLPTIAPDGAGGAIVTWTDYRSGNRDVYAQRISAGGAAQWTTDGVALCTATGDQDLPRVAPDGAGGAIVTWQDPRGSGFFDLYAQRISAGGGVQWTTDGVALCTATGDQTSPAITSDGAGGAIAAWPDSRSGGYDLYAQRISNDGTVQWSIDGVALSSASGDQWTPTITPDGAGGALVAWQDYRNGNGDIYAQRVKWNGALGGDAPTAVQGGTPLAFALEPVHPNPARGGVLTVRFALGSAAPASLELLDVAGRRIAARSVGSLGAGRHEQALGEGRHLAPGLYLVRLRQGTDTRVTRVAVLK